MANLPNGVTHGDAGEPRTCTWAGQRGWSAPVLSHGSHMSDRKKTGAGAEAAEGIHSADRGGRSEEKNTALENADRQADGDARRRGSEPTTSHATEHKSSYGGGGSNGGVK